MHDTVNQGDVPRPALIGAGLLVGFALVLAGSARYMHWNISSVPTSNQVTTLHLAFRDRTDGAVEVLDADHGNAPYNLVPANSGGFVRGVLRSLARARRAAGVAATPPFTLTRWGDGRLTLDDPQTGQHVDLVGFGPTNSGAFARLLTPDLVLANQPAETTSKDLKP